MHKKALSARARGLAIVEEYLQAEPDVVDVISTVGVLFTYPPSTTS